MLEPDSYYQYRHRQAQVGGDVFPFFTRPALAARAEDLTPALLLAEQLVLPPDGQVVHLHCGGGLLGAIAAKRVPSGYVTLLDSHHVAVETARRTLAVNKATNAEPMLSDCAQAVRNRSFDCAVALMPKGRAVWEQTVIDAAAVLHPGGSLYLAGAKRGGILSAAKFADHVFGNVRTLAYRGGCRVLQAIRQSTIHLPENDYYAWRQVVAQVGDTQLQYLTKPGLFAWKELDQGTRLLVEALQANPLRPDDRVLDIGCGSGVLTLVAARQASRGHVIGLDVDCRAVEATRRTLDLNRIERAEARLSDCGEAVQDKRFTAIVSNPPFHREHSTTLTIAAQIIREAARLLEPQGRLYLVANSFLRYGPLVDAAFGNATQLGRTSKFTVWHAVKER